VATVSRIDKIVCLFCRISSLLQGSFAKETYNCINPTNQSHPIAHNQSRAHANLFGTRTHAHAHVHTHTSTHMCTHTCTHTRIYTRRHARRQARTHAHMHAHAHTYAYTRTHSHARLRARSLFSTSWRTRARVHKHTNAHINEHFTSCSLLPTFLRYLFGSLVHARSFSLSPALSLSLFALPLTYAHKQTKLFTPTSAFCT